MRFETRVAAVLAIQSDRYQDGGDGIGIGKEAVFTCFGKPSKGPAESRTQSTRLQICTVYMSGTISIFPTGMALLRSAVLLFGSAITSSFTLL